MAAQANDASNDCKPFCIIARAKPNSVSEVKILTDDTGCVTSDYTGDRFKYATNDPLACPLV